MNDPVDHHFRMADEQDSIQRMKAAIKVLQDADIPFTVEGGWAVASYGSTVPSIDLDVLIPGGLDTKTAATIEAATQYQMYSQSTRDLLALDFVDADLANSLLDRPGLAYTPSTFLAGNTEPRTIADDVTINVPRAPFLVFMKLKAFHDRRMQWQAARGERYLLAAMSEEERERTIRLGEGHWLRKAGKDLFDAAFLLQGHTTLDEVERISPPAMLAKIQGALVDIPLPIRAFAKDMAQRAGSGPLDHFLD